MKKETAVEWLFEQLKLSSKKIDEINNEHLFFYRMFVQAKAMEKEQVKDAYKFGLSDEYVIGSERYYNETFKSE
jgi:hypothetical protein